MDAAKIIAMVQRQIEKNGRLITMGMLDSSPAEFNKPWKGPGQPVVSQTLDCKGIFLPASGDSFGSDFISNDLLMLADEVLMVAPNGNDLTTFQVLIDHGLRWRIQWAKVLQPGDDVLLYAFGVKR